MKYSVRRVRSLTDIHFSEWNQLTGDTNPFLKHEFLSGLERYDCLTSHGWYPCHIIVESGKKLLAALPLYFKTNSIGEFVFDWQWAEAYENAGGKYYPKLVSAIPFTPVTGDRCLISPGLSKQEFSKILIDAAKELANETQASGLHILFPETKKKKNMTNMEMMLRKGCQYHWLNQGYSDFEDFLGRLSAKRRKQIRKERKALATPEFNIQILRGNEITEHHWKTFHNFYASTFYKKWGEPRFTRKFLDSLSQSMPESVLLIMARHDNNYVAGALAFEGGNTLFGRHWGCSDDFKFLHFELCYYQTIEYCIEHGLYRLDAGAQGEHKIWRGFSPVETWSAHWLINNNFSKAIGNFLKQETRYIDSYINDLAKHTAYRHTGDP